MMAKFLTKHDENPYADLFWNLPEVKKRSANVIGGNLQNFQTVVRTAEFLASHFPLESVSAIIPETLRSKVPDLPNFQFLPATDSGSFNGDKMVETINAADANLVVGELSKNSITARAVLESLAKAEKPVMVTRDAVDLLASQNPESVFLNSNVSLLATAAQLQKLLRAIYYPRVMTLSQSLLQIAELLHKFTISYPLGIVTLFSGQIMVAKDGAVESTPLFNSKFSPITLWSGQFASQLVALNLYNPQDFVRASIAAVFYRENLPS